QSGGSPSIPGSEFETAIWPSPAPSPTTTSPTTTSPTSTNITSTTATLGGTVSSDGGASITKRGVVYAKTSDNSNPRIGGIGVTGAREVPPPAGPTGTFTETITGLTPGTGYSFVAFATNSAGTSYTSPVSTFTTPTYAESLDSSGNLTITQDAAGANDNLTFSL